MCNIWKTPREVVDLPIEHWIDLLSSPLFTNLRELDITGGEPFLREDILELMGKLPYFKDIHLKKIKSVAITTNGFLTQRILEYTPIMLKLLKPVGMDLIMVCAMDAIGEIHDQIRNFRGAWAGVNQTIQGLKTIRSSNSNLIIGIKTTILPQNVDELEHIARYADENGLFTIISPCIITENRYQNIDRKRDLDFAENDVEKMVRFFKGRNFRWDFHRDCLINYFKTGEIKKPCSAGFNYFFIRSNGDVYPCPLVKFKVGNFMEKRIDDLYFSKDTSHFRRKVGKYSECRQCTEPGVERYSLPCEGFSYLFLLAKMGKKNFLNFHEHMGLDKYFN
jgi:MoaA/NifB/PqqE/SkfB family radical SAM enzyme